MENKEKINSHNPSENDDKNYIQSNFIHKSNYLKKKL